MVKKKTAPKPDAHVVAASPPAGEKLQKVLARAGVGSRREMERWISEGRITVDGKPVKLGDRIGPHHVLRIDGRVLPSAALAPKARVLIYHKPEGEITSRGDPEGRPTVFDRLPVLRQGRWVAIGRLDYNSSGILLLTTDGELANRLMHPSREIEREYAVRVLGQVTGEMLDKLKRGVELEDGLATFESVVDAGGAGANRWYHVVLKEGRNREVRRMWEAVGAKVSRLIRVRYGTVTLPRLVRPGRTEELDRDALAELYLLVGMKPPARTRPAHTRPTRPVAAPARRKQRRVGRTS